MTLTKIKQRRPPSAHKRRLGQHHRHSNMYLKAYWPYLPIVFVVVCGLAVNSLLSQQHKSVLGYATDMSIQSLLDDTNAQRANNGEGPLTINADLDQAAQTKANDMAAQDYWSHDTPEGQTPWSFIIAAGYDYQTAGENLAYGFDTSADVLTGWMNSPEHRANILNTTYHDVGFGIVNIANYQDSGPETLVDAMYGSLAGEAVVAATPKPQVPVTTPVAKPAPTPVSQTNTEPAPTSTPPSSQPVITPVATTQPASSAPAATTPTVTLEPQQQISRIQLVAAGDSTTGILLVVVFGCSAFVFLLLRHGIAWHKTINKGEKFILRHPTLDVVAVTIIVTSVILTRVTGVIK
jgi:uncharacterized protein YkwD